ncbi:MAG: hypothetical protein OEP95_03160 [Myxococcales bacterium]|nr:hypothetical protein [Myxococcales bacterium]
MSQFALEQHDLGDRKRLALRERNLFERRHRAIADPAERQVRTERARLRLETGLHDRGLDPLGERRERALGADPGGDDARATGGRERLDRTQLKFERRAALHTRGHLTGQTGDRSLFDLSQEPERQVIALGAHPADGSTSRRRLERGGDSPHFTTGPLRKRDGQERTQTHVRFLAR